MSEWDGTNAERHWPQGENIPSCCNAPIPPRHLKHYRRIIDRMSVEAILDWMAVEEETETVGPDGLLRGKTRREQLFEARQYMKEQVESYGPLFVIDRAAMLPCARRWNDKHDLENT